jgi:hypothetical protein
MQVPEAVADALDCLDAQVGGFGAGVGDAAGGVEGQDLVFPAVQGAYQPPGFGRVDGGGPGVVAANTCRAWSTLSSLKQATDELFELPRGGDLPVGIAGA